MAGYLELARAARTRWRGSGTERVNGVARDDSGREKSELSEKRVATLEAALAASPALRVLVGDDPPPAPATVCCYCGRGSSPANPLLTYLDGHADHGGFCPPRRRKGKPPA